MADRKRTCGEDQQGLTLLECLATLAIIAILTAMAVPSFRDQIADAQVRGAATTLYAAMQFARAQHNVVARSSCYVQWSRSTPSNPSVPGILGKGLARYWLVITDTNC